MSRNLDNVPLAEWEYQELLDAVTWIVISGLTKGEPLRSILSQVLQLALNWKAAKEK